MNASKLNAGPSPAAASHDDHPDVSSANARAGLVPGDREIAAKLRKLENRTWLVVNKTEGMPRDTAIAEFHELGLGDPAAISAAHGEGVNELMEAVLAPFPEERDRDDHDEKHPRVHVNAADWSDLAQFLHSDPALKLDYKDEFEPD